MSHGRPVFFFVDRLFFLIKPSTSSLLGRPLRAFLTIYFHPSCPSNVLPWDRPLFYFKTVHFRGPSTLTQDRSLSVIWTVQFKPPWPSTLDLTPFLKIIFIEKLLLIKKKVEPSLLDLGDPIFSTWKIHTIFSTSIFWFWNVPILSGVFGILEEILQSGEIGTFKYVIFYQNTVFSTYR